MTGVTVPWSTISPDQLFAKPLEVVIDIAENEVNRDMRWIPAEIIMCDCFVFYGLMRQDRTKGD